MQTKLISILTLVPTLSFGVISFEGLLPGIDQHQDPRSEAADGNYTFSSGGIAMSYDRTFDGAAWEGITFSTDTLSAVQLDFSQDQFIAAPGSASAGLGYGVVFPPFGSPATLDFGGLVSNLSIDVTNTLWTYESMLTGAYPGAFPIQNGAFDDNSDFHTLAINGVGADDSLTGAVTFDLGRGTNLVDTWETLDLQTLGTVRALEITFNSSDPFLPNYVAIDNVDFAVVPEPSTYALFISCIIFGWALRRKWMLHALNDPRAF